MNDDRLSAIVFGLPVSTSFERDIKTGDATLYVYARVYGTRCIECWLSREFLEDRTDLDLKRDIEFLRVQSAERLRDELLEGDGDWGMV